MIALLAFIALTRPDPVHATDWNIDQLQLNGTVYQTVVDWDGRLIVGGDFSSANGKPVPGLLRLTRDGEIDWTFRPFSGPLQVTADERHYPWAQSNSGNWLADRMPQYYAQSKITISAMAAGAGGKLYVAGFYASAASPSSQRYSFLFRMLEDGGHDGTFGLYQPYSVLSEISVLRLTEDESALLVGGLYLGGKFGNIGSFYATNYPETSLIRLATEGRSLHQWDNPSGGKTYAVFPGQQVPFGVDAINTRFANQVRFTHGRVQALAFDHHGFLWVGGDFKQVNGQTHRGLARLSGPTTVDSNFILSARATNARVREIIPLGPEQIDLAATGSHYHNTGAVLVGGAFTTIGGASYDRLALVTYNLVGYGRHCCAASTTLHQLPMNMTSLPPLPSVSALEHHGDGVLVSGGFDRVNGLPYRRMIRLKRSSHGVGLELDTSFPNLNIDGQVFDISKDPKSGVVIVAGNPLGSAHQGRPLLARTEFEADSVVDYTEFPIQGSSTPIPYDAGSALVTLEDFLASEPSSEKLIQQSYMKTADKLFRDDEVVKARLNHMRQPTKRTIIHRVMHPWYVNQPSFPPLKLTPVAGDDSLRDHWPGAKAAVEPDYDRVHHESPSYSRCSKPLPANDFYSEWMYPSPYTEFAIPYYLPQAWRWSDWDEYRDTYVRNDMQGCTWVDRFVASRLTQGYTGPSWYDPDPERPSFSGVDGQVNDVLVDHHGRTYLAGRFVNVDGRPAPGLVRLKVGGTLDMDFDIGTVTGVVIGIRYEMLAIALQNNRSHHNVGQEPIVGVYRSTVKADGGVFRFHSNGQPDSGFSLDSTIKLHRIHTLAVDSQDRIYLGGFFTLPNNVQTGLVRLHPNGLRDTSFNTVVDGDVYDIDPVRYGSQAGNVYLSGDFSHVNGHLRNDIACVGGGGGICSNFTIMTTGTGRASAVLMAIPVAADTLHPTSIYTLLVGGDFKNVVRSTTDPTPLQVNGLVSATIDGNYVGPISRVADFVTANEPFDRVETIVQERLTDPRFMVHHESHGGGIGEHDRIYIGGRFVAESASASTDERGYGNVVRYRLESPGQLTFDAGWSKSFFDGDAYHVVKAVAMDPRDDAYVTGTPDGYPLLQVHYNPNRQFPLSPVEYRNFAVHDIDRRLHAGSIPRILRKEDKARVVVAGGFDRVSQRSQPNVARFDRCGTPEHVAPLPGEKHRPAHEFPLTLYEDAEHIGAWWPRFDVRFNYTKHRHVRPIVLDNEDDILTLDPSAMAFSDLILQLTPQIGPWASLCPGDLKRYFPHFTPEQIQELEIVPMHTPAGGFRMVVWSRQIWTEVLATHLSTVYSNIKLEAKETVGECLEGTDIKSGKIGFYSILLYGSCTQQQTQAEWIRPMQEITVMTAATVVLSVIPGFTGAGIASKLAVLPVNSKVWSSALILAFLADSAPDFIDDPEENMVPFMIQVASASLSMGRMFAGLHSATIYGNVALAGLSGGIPLFEAVRDGEFTVEDLRSWEGVSQWVLSIALAKAAGKVTAPPTTGAPPRS